MNNAQIELPNETSNLSEAIYRDLRAKLIAGELAPAETVSIRKLADRYEVSGMPVREALRQLASEGALISEARKAYRVPDLSDDEAADLFFVRAILEGAAAEIAAPKMTSATFEALDGIISIMNSRWAELNAGGFLLANYRFHRTIYQACGNKAMTANIDRLYVQTGPWLAHGIVNLVNPENWLDEHPLIVAALRAGDSKQTRKLMEEDAFWGVKLYRRRP